MNDQRYPATKESEQTLATLERCVIEGGVEVRQAIDAAYQLGKLHGALQVAGVAIKGFEKLKEAA